MFRRVDKLMEVERSGATSSERLTWLHPLQGRGAPKSSRLEHPLSTDLYTAGRWFDSTRAVIVGYQTGQVLIAWLRLAQPGANAEGRSPHGDPRLRRVHRHALQWSSGPSGVHSVWGGTT